MHLKSQKKKVYKSNSAVEYERFRTTKKMTNAYMKNQLKYKAA